MKMNKNIVVTTIKILMGLVILLGVLSFIYPQEMFRRYLTMNIWINSINKTNFVTYKDYKVILPKKWYFDLHFNDSFAAINQYPQSLFDNKCFDISTTIQYTPHQIPKNLSGAKTNKYNFKCIKKTRPNLPDTYYCKPKNKPFIFTIESLFNLTDINESMNDLMKNTKIEKL